MAFTTWAALKTAILNDLADGSVLTQHYSIDGRSRSFHSLAEVREFLAFCDSKIMSSNAQYDRHTHVKFARPR